MKALMDGKQLDQCLVPPMSWYISARRMTRPSYGRVCTEYSEIDHDHLLQASKQANIQPNTHRAPWEGADFWQHRIRSSRSVLGRALWSAPDMVVFSIGR